MSGFNLSTKIQLSIIHNPSYRHSKFVQIESETILVLKIPSYSGAIFTRKHMLTKGSEHDLFFTNIPRGFKSSSYENRGH